MNNLWILKMNRSASSAKLRKMEKKILLWAKIWFMNQNTLKINTMDKKEADNWEICEVLQSVSFIRRMYLKVFLFYVSWCDKSGCRRVQIVAYYFLTFQRIIEEAAGCFLWKIKTGKLHNFTWGCVSGRWCSAPSSCRGWVWSRRGLSHRNSGRSWTLNRDTLSHLHATRAMSYLSSEVCGKNAQIFFLIYITGLYASLMVILVSAEA